MSSVAICSQREWMNSEAAAGGRRSVLPQDDPLDFAPELQKTIVAEWRGQAAVLVPAIVLYSGSGFRGSLSGSRSRNSCTIGRIYVELSHDIVSDISRS
jgi:hypothetical protein